MKILIISDTHDKLDKVLKVISQLKSNFTIDKILHCGDFEADGMELEKLTGIPTLAVKGNMDGGRSTDFKILETEAGKFLITHGHEQNVNLSLDRLSYLAEENQCIGAVFGHTHRAKYITLKGLHLINPGSISFPRDNSSGTFALLTTEKSMVEVELLEYEKFIIAQATAGDEKSHTKKTKVRGGHLRDLINYSDRF